MPHLPDAIIQVFAPFAPLFADRVWLHAHVFLLGAILTPGARTVTAALRVMGLATERPCTHDHRVLNRAAWSTRHASKMLLEVLILLLGPWGAPMVLGADETVERRSGRKIAAKGGDRDAVRSSQQPGIRGCGLQWVAMMRLGPVPWSRRVWALPWLTTLGGPPKQATPCRPKTSGAWVRQMMKPVRRWLPGRRLVRVVDGGFAAVALALACVTHPGVRVSRLRWDAALDHPPGPQPPGTRGPNPLTGNRQRRLQAWAARADTPWDTVDVA